MKVLRVLGEWLRGLQPTTAVRAAVALFALGVAVNLLALAFDLPWWPRWPLWPQNRT